MFWLAEQVAGVVVVIAALTLTWRIFCWIVCGVGDFLDQPACPRRYLPGTTEKLPMQARREDHAGEAVAQDHGRSDRRNHYRQRQYPEGLGARGRPVEASQRHAGSDSGGSRWNAENF